MGIYIVIGPILGGEVTALRRRQRILERWEDEEFKPGDFAENITTQGLNLAGLRVGDKIEIQGKIKARVTQIGKECHTRCAIYKRVGKCIMPKEGIFAEVLKGGKVKVGDEIRIDSNDKDCHNHGE